MASILDMLNTPLGDNLVTKISEQFSETNKKKIFSVLGLSLPALIVYLRENISSLEQKEKLHTYLKAQTETDYIVKNLADIPWKEASKKGEEILEFFFNKGQNKISQSLAEITNFDKTKISESLKIEVQLIFQILAYLMRKEAITASKIAELLDSLIGSSAAYSHSLIESFLREDEEGNRIHSAAGMVLGGNTSTKKEGSILGGFTGGK